MEDIAVIGAGPYGLSVVAHLAASNLKLRAFGTPMQTWRHQMPAGMRLKSEGCASTLYDPGMKYPFRKFCEERGIHYADYGSPVTREDFADYGMEFAKRYAPMLEDRTVSALRRIPEGFELIMADGGAVRAKRVVAAVGITHYAYMPPLMAGLPRDLVSHSSAHNDLSVFAGKTVAVVGGGASATDCAGLLAQAGATTHLLTRGARVGFHDPPRRWTWKDRLKTPRTTIGPGWRSVLLTRGPVAFHAMPAELRIRVTRRYLGPAGCWFMRDAVQSTVMQHTNITLKTVSVRFDGRVELSFEEPAGRSLEADHVIAATGYRVDLARLPFLAPQFREQIAIDETGAPVLSRWFESSVPGLYFVGPSAANSFGPLLRFACGAQFAARRLSRHML